MSESTYVPRDAAHQRGPRTDVFSATTVDSRPVILAGVGRVTVPPSMLPDHSSTTSLLHPTAAQIYGLQRTIGNRQVQRLLAPRDAVIQRMRPDEVRGVFGEAEVYQDALGMAFPQLAPAVVTAIVAATTTFEQRSPAGEKQRKTQLTKLITHFVLSTLDEWIRNRPTMPVVQRFFTDPAYWTQQVATFITQIDLNRQQREAQVAAQIAHNNMQALVPYGQRVLVECTMGQGVIADLRKFTLFSDQFSTCSAVAMYNETTHIGGLFHYGAGSKEQLGQLGQMVAAIQPTQAWIDQRTQQMPGDFGVLNNFFQGYGITPIALPESDQCRLYLTNANAPGIDNQHPDFSSWLNLTQQTPLPGLLQGNGYTLYFNSNVYSPGFAKE